MNQFRKPYYLVEFTSSLCNFDIYINGLPAFSHNQGGGISSHAPINQFILESGKQKININIFPIKGEIKLRNEGFIKIRVFSYDSSTTNYENKIICFEHTIDNFSKNTNPIIYLQGNFIAQVPYNIEGWKNTDIFDKNSDRNNIVSYYKSIYKLFKESNINGIYNEMKTKFFEVDTTMYLENQNNKDSLFNLLKMLKDENFVFQPFPNLTNNIKFFANDKVCYFFREDGTHLIYYKNDKTNETFFMPIFITKNNYKLSIIR